MGFCDKTYISDLGISCFYTPSEQWNSECFVFNRKKGLTIWYYSPIAYPAFRGQEFKGKGALCV